MAGRKKKNHDSHIDESWLIPYADLLTLLLALFIVLFASSSIDAVKYQQIKEAFNSAFDSGGGILEDQIPVELEPEENDDEPLANDEESKEEAEAKRRAALEVEQLKELQGKINDYIIINDLNQNFNTELTKEGLLITILDVALFDSGSAEVKAEAEQLAEEMSRILVTNPPRNIVISGHTDNIPIKTVRYESNWHLSVMRAVNYMKILLENDELDPKKFSAKGFGEHKPVGDNRTSLGRQKNRRVEVLVLPNYTATNQNSNQPE